MLRNSTRFQESKIFIVSNRLPVKVENGKVSATTGGLASALSGLNTHNPLLWIGWNGSFIDSSSEEDNVRQQIRGITGSKFKYEPVFLTKQQIVGFYDGFSNGSLWPILHYFNSLAVFEEEWYKQYLEVNKIFCEVVVKIVGDDDVVWVHDYHLMLLPAMLREKKPNLRIGFFLHVPFPSFEIFRCIPQRKELIEGMLGADHIGFHTFSYMRHFKSCVLRVLGMECSFDEIKSDGRNVRLGTHPIGINWNGFKTATESEECLNSFNDYARDFANRKLVVSVSRLDYTKGLPAMLEAIAYYLEHMPHNNEVTFLIIAVPSRDAVQSYIELKEKVVKTIGEINGKYSQISAAPPIHFIYYSVNLNKLAAVYQIADVGLIIPLIDGMNLVAKEFVALQPETFDAKSLKRPGILILSEFTGAAQELYNAMLVNPYDAKDVAKAIDRALNMSPEDKVKLNAPMRKRVQEQDAGYWSKRFLNELMRDSPNPDRCKPKKVDEIVPLFLPTVPGKKVLFMDYDGTLTPIVSMPHLAVPSQELLQVLDRVTRRKDLDCIILSGRPVDFLEKHLGHLPITLVAEHGFKIRKPGSEWVNFNSSLVFDWKEQILPFLEMYANDTPGSFIEEKRSSLVWHYRLSEPELGQHRAADLVGQLSEFVSNLPIAIHHGKKNVEVSSIEIGKGNVVKQFMREHDYSVGLCVGDDTTDENMFRVTNPKLVKIRIGAGDTVATYRWKEPNQVVDFLSKISLKDDM